MRLSLCIHGAALLQLLLHIPCSAIPQHASYNLPQALTARDDTTAVATQRSWPNHGRHFFTVTTLFGLTFLMRFNVLEMVRPSDALANMAADDLVHFYQAAFAVANVLWARDEPRTVRRARMNGILLMFWSEAPIGWDFLKGFFEHIIDRTYGGLVGGYDVTCIAQIGDAVVHVSLSLPTSDPHLAAPTARL